MIEVIWLVSALADGAWLEALLRAALRGAVLLLAAGAATLLLRRASAAARHLVWALAFAGLLALPLLPVLLPPVEVPLPPAGLALLERVGMETPEFPEVEIPFTVEVQPDPQPLAPPPGFPADDPALAPPPPPEAAAAPAVLPPVEVHHAGFAPDWTVLLLFGWVLGTLLVLGTLALGVLGVWREGRRAEPVAEGRLAELLEALRAEAGVRRPTGLLLGGASAMPVTWGALRPRILLPAEAERWPAERLRAVLLHELAHVRRGDWATQLGVEAACALYWFNPLVWAAARRLREEGEHACDDQVLSAGSRPSDYAGHLLEVARTLRAGRTAHAASVAMARPAQIRGRLLAVLAEGRRRGPVSRGFALPALLAAAAAVALLASLTPAAGAAGPGPDPRFDPDTLPWAAVAPVAATGALAATPATPLAPAVAPTAALAPTSALAPPAGTLAPVAAPAPQAAAGRCSQEAGSSRHDSARDDLHRETSWHNQRGCGGRAESVGRVEFTRDRADVARVGPGGRFVLELYDDGDRRRVEIAPAGGGMRRSYTVNGRERAWDDEARRWMAAALAEYFRAVETPAPVPPTPPTPPSSGERAAALVQALDTHDAADTDLLRRTVRESRGLASDGDRRTVLEAVAARSGGDQAVLREVIAAARAIASSGDRARLLLGIGALGGLATDTQVKLIRAAGELPSQGDRARVLRGLVERHGIRSAAARDAFFGVAEGIGSGAERRDVLLAAVRRDEMDDSRTQRVIGAARGIPSDAERAAVLLALADRGLVSEPVRASYVGAAEALRSEGERERVLARIGLRAPGTDPRAENATTTSTWSDGEGRRVRMEARGVEVDADGDLRIRPGGHLSFEDTRPGFRQGVRVEPGPGGRLRRTYTGDSVDPARRLEWEARLVARFAAGEPARW